MSDDEVSDILESQFDEACAIAVVVGRPDLECKIVQLGIEKGRSCASGRKISTSRLSR
jgi:hypothetical protein